MTAMTQDPEFLTLECGERGLFGPFLGELSHFQLYAERELELCRGRHLVSAHVLEREGVNTKELNKALRWHPRCYS